MIEVECLNENIKKELERLFFESDYQLQKSKE